MPPADSPQNGIVRRLAQKVRVRREFIMERLANGSTIPIDELVASLETSPATVRRDLRELLREGMIHREHGVVGPAESFISKRFLSDPGYKSQARHMAEEKRRIGLAAVELVEDGEVIGIAPGTTTAQLVRRLHTKRGLTIVTNAVNVAMELSRRKECTVNLTGGYLSGDWFAMVGPRALDFIKTIYLDQFFFGANGVHFEHGITDRHTEEAAVNEALAGRAKQRIVLADHTKFGQSAMCRVCDILAVDLIITDSAATDDDVARFQAKGIKVRRV